MSFLVRFARCLRTSRVRIFKGKRTNLLECGWSGIGLSKFKPVFEVVF